MSPFSFSFVSISATPWSFGQSNPIFENLTNAGCTDAVANAQGDKSRGTERVVEAPTVDVAAARKKLGLSQDKFARAFGVSPGTIRNWEQGRRRPEGPPRVLLRVIEKEPEAVLRALHAA